MCGSIGPFLGRCRLRHAPRLLICLTGVVNFPHGTLHAMRKHKRHANTWSTHFLVHMCIGRDMHVRLVVFPLFCCLWLCVWINVLCHWFGLFVFKWASASSVHFSPRPVFHALYTCITACVSSPKDWSGSMSSHMRQDRVFVFGAFVHLFGLFAAEAYCQTTGDIFFCQTLLSSVCLNSCFTPHRETSLKCRFEHRPTLPLRHAELLSTLHFPGIV